MTARVLLAALAVLAALTYQHSQVRRLRAELTEAQRHVLDARAMVADNLGVSNGEFARTVAWLHEYYRSPDGLGRPAGLCPDGRPDAAALDRWVFEQYLARRVRGESEGQARQAVETALRQTDEWRLVHGVRP